MDYSEYEVTEDGSVYTFDDSADSLSVNLTFPRDDMHGEKIELTDSDRFSRFNLKIADQLMYMDAQQMAEFVNTIDDPALLRSIIVAQKNLHQQLEFERHDEEVMNANTEEQKEALREEHTPLGDETLLEVSMDEAAKRFTEHEVSLIDYDYTQVNEDSGTDKQVAAYADREFGSLTEIMMELQQQDFPKGIPRNLLGRLAEDHLGMNQDEVESTLEEMMDAGQVHETFPHHYQAYWP